MNDHGELKIQGLMIALITAFGLFFGLLAFTMDSLDNSYVVSDYDESSLTKYDYLTDLSSDIDAARNITEGMQVKSDVFDWFAGVWNKLTQPFRLIFTSYGNLIDATDDAVTDLKLPPVYRAYFSAAIIILVVIGIVMIKFYLGRSK